MSRNAKGRGVGPKVYDRMTADLPINSKVALAIVDDPYSYNGEKLRVVRSVRDDPLAALLARREIDQALYDAGRLYERYAEQAEIGSISAIDPAKEAVDGGKFIEPITDRQIAAVRQLAEAARVLGHRGEWLVRELLVRRRRFKEIGAALGVKGEREMNRLRHRFFECLETLAEFWGCKSRA